MSGDGAKAPLAPAVGDAVDRATTLAAVRRRLFDTPTEVPALSRHILLRRLGAGGSGVVYEAYDPELDRKVAIKLLQARSQQADSAGTARLKREAQAIARVSHPNVIAVHDVGTYSEREAAGLLATIRDRESELEIPSRGVFIVMELVSGVSLRAWVADRPGHHEVLAVFGQAGRGLAAAHAEGLVHRDFKPDNVLVSHDSGGPVRARVLDFGLARRTGPAVADAEPGRPGLSITHLETVSATGSVLGTPAYMSPEQHRGVQADARSDQYNFTVALWEALVGERPFRADPLDDLLALKQAGPPIWPAGVKVADRIRAAIARGLEPDPSRRFATMNAMLAELDKQPLARMRWAALGVVVLAGAGVAGASVGSVTTEDACVRASQAATEVWTDGRAAALQERLRDLDPQGTAALWPGTAQRLTRYAETWHEARAALCGVDAPPEQVDATRACLERRRSDFEITLRVLTSVSSAAEAQRVVEGLRDVTRCRDATARYEVELPPPGPERIEANDVGALLVESDLHERAGQSEAARIGAQEALERARALGHPPTTARALSHQALLIWNEDRHEDALAMFVEAAVTAERAGDIRAALSAQISTARLLSKGLQRHDEASRLLDLVEARADRHAPHDTILASQLARTRGLMLLRRGHFDEAEAQLSRVAELVEQRGGGDGLEMASALVPLSQARQNLGQHEEALAGLDRALAIRKSIVGEGPGDAMIHNNRGTVLWRLGRFDAACASYTRARSAFVQQHGAVHSNVAMVDNNLGTCATWRGDHHGALALHRRSLATKLEQLGPEHPDLGYSYANIARALLATDRLDAAQAAFERARELWMQGLAPEHPLVAEPVAGLAEIELRRGDSVAARHRFERAQELARDSRLHALQNTIRFGLARCLASEDPERAMALVRAVVQSSAIDADPELRAQAGRWLEEHS